MAVTDGQQVAFKIVLLLVFIIHGFKVYVVSHRCALLAMRIGITPEENEERRKKERKEEKDKGREKRGVILTASTLYTILADQSKTKSYKKYTHIRF